MNYKVVADTFEYECDLLAQAIAAYDILSKYVEFYGIQSTVHLFSGQTIWEEYRPDIKAAPRGNHG